MRPIRLREKRRGPCPSWMPRTCSGVLHAGFYDADAYPAWMPRTCSGVLHAGFYDADAYPAWMPRTCSGVLHAGFYDADAYPAWMPRTCSGVLHAGFYDADERERPRSKSGASLGAPDAELETSVSDPGLAITHPTSTLQQRSARRASRSRMRQRGDPSTNALSP